MTQPPPPPPNQPPKDQPPGRQGAFGPPEPPQDAAPQADQGARPTPGAPAAPPAAQPPQPQPQYGAPPQPQPGYGHPPAPQPPQQPQPGYGYPAAPQPPQPQPGYGYPAAAPQPPQPQPGYGYPGTAPQPQPPYGAAAPYGQQPGYGYPGQPVTVPLRSPSAPAGGRKVNASTVIIVAAVVAIALIVGGGIWYSGSSGGGGTQGGPTASAGPTGGDGKGGVAKGGEKVPADPGAKPLFQVPMPTVAKDDSVAVDGSWLTDTAYVKSGVAEIVGYDRDKGTELWTVKLPGPVCAASRRTNEDGRTAIVFQPKMPPKDSTAGCTQVAAIDLNAGRQLWTKTVNSGDALIDFDNVTVSANTVAVGSTDGGAAFDITTGKVLWSPKTSDTCYDAGYGGGAKLVAVRKCGSYDAPQLHIQTIDPASGKVLSEYKMATDIEYAGVVSTDPLVVAADVGDSAGDGSGISDFFSIDNRTGELRTRISAPGDEYAAECDSIDTPEACTGLAVGNDRLYIATEERDTDNGSRGNSIVAFDLGTGKQTGQRADSGADYTLFPLRMDGGDVIAYKEPPYDKGGQVVSIDGGSFKETELLENTGSEEAREMESAMSPEYSEILYSQGRLYMAGTYADADSVGDKEYLAIAFGTSG
ncbi:outer membrane protein assembly factor BamB family protein [Streptomyces sp. NBC_00582]|uniref:outer membrane protein assembly factor BamB family protein n=1 Tax=Streptomyces sp. NBC_00582 TaxID=2975783 RepID=UPI002E8225EF|nr:PQQ-binding-like beta-propeller repeat protein [Streptomyces sp. NBC_00582]WUB64058.1 PQQ-like beta-propeller repeat protein [Streptomyces sp. NBC_00582]